MLSLYEFYLLSKQYEPGSLRFREVVEKTIIMYPNKNITLISMAMFGYLDGKVKTALKFLDGLENDPEAWPYFSSLHAANGDPALAGYYAEKAAEARNPEAEAHIRQIEEYKESAELYRGKPKE